jgi:hypothetical protein
MNKIKSESYIGFFFLISYTGCTVAAGFVTLPSSGATPYVGCNISGNFGFMYDSTYPTTPDDACVVPKGLAVGLSLNASPEDGFVLQTANNSAISAFSESLGTLTERVFRNAPTSECIYAKQVLMSGTSTHDYHPQLNGNQKIEVNDFVFGGYTGNASVGYAKQSNSFPSVYRIGRTFTSVQKQNTSGYIDIPAAGGVVGTEINGVGQTFSPIIPTALQQQAPFSANWIDFTTRVTAGIDQNGVAFPSSPNMYIKQTCTTSSTSVVPNSFKLRQTGRLTQPWVVITSSSRAPSADIAP